MDVHNVEIIGNEWDIIILCINLAQLIHSLVALIEIDSFDWAWYLKPDAREIIKIKFTE